MVDHNLHKEELALGVEASGLDPENYAVQTPALKRPQNSASLLFDIPGKKFKRVVKVCNIIGITAFIILIMSILNIFYKTGQLNASLWYNAVNSEAWVNFYLPGLLKTLLASVIAVILSTIFGLFFGSVRLLPSRLTKVLSGSIVEFSRAVPVLLLMIFFWRLFAFIGLESNASFWAVIIALTLYNGSVIAELVRSGVVNLPKGQEEAANALGLSTTGSLIHILLPQAIKMMIPAIVTQMVVVLKDTALGAMIMYTDLLQESRYLGASHINILQTLVVATCIYFIVCYILTQIIERTVGVK